MSDLAPYLSVIVPALNEAAWLPRTLAAVTDGLDSDGELIVVDGGSADRSVEVAGRCGARVVHAPPGRACQMNAGAAEARGEVLLFLHADTLLPCDFACAIRTMLANPTVVGGAFRLRIEGVKRSLRVIERLVAWRCRWRSMPYGDQGIFLRAATFRALGGYRPLPVMEDYDLVQRLRRLGRVALANSSVVTSGRRWHERGVWRTTVLNQACIAAFRLGVPCDRIAAWRNAASRR